MNQRVGPALQAYEGQRDDRQSNLQTHGAPFFSARFAPAPLCRGLVAEMPDPPEDSQIHYCANRGEDQHGDADCILVPAFGGSVDSADGGEGRQSDRDPDTADGEDGCAEALQQREEHAAPAERTGLAHARNETLGRSFDFRQMVVRVDWQVFDLLGEALNRGGSKRVPNQD